MLSVRIQSDKLQKKYMCKRSSSIMLKNQGALLSLVKISELRECFVSRTDKVTDMIGYDWVSDDQILTAIKVKSDDLKLIKEIPEHLIEYSGVNDWHNYTEKWGITVDRHVDVDKWNKLQIARIAALVCRLIIIKYLDPIMIHLDIDDEGGEFRNETKIDGNHRVRAYEFYQTFVFAKESLQHTIPAIVYGNPKFVDRLAKTKLAQLVNIEKLIHLYRTRTNLSSNCRYHWVTDEMIKEALTDPNLSYYEGNDNWHNYLEKWGIERKLKNDKWKRAHLLRIASLVRTMLCLKKQKFKTHLDPVTILAQTGKLSNKTKIDGNHRYRAYLYIHTQYSSNEFTYMYAFMVGNEDTLRWLCRLDDKYVDS